jgi:hypothetical protein
MTYVSPAELIGEAYSQDDLLRTACRDDLSLSTRLLLIMAWAIYEEEIPQRDGEFSRAIDHCVRAIESEIARVLPGDRTVAATFVRKRIQHAYCSACEPKWKWPVVNIGHSRGGMEPDWREFSALKMFGYTVGKTAGWPKAKRQMFLTDFMDLDLPQIVEATFGNEYGKPLTTNRLRKVANLLATNCSNFMKNDEARYAVAISDYLEDLKFLKARYYEGHGLKFVPWPDPRV